LIEVFVWTKSNPPPSSNENVATTAFEFVFCFSRDIKKGSRKIPCKIFKGHELSTNYTSGVADGKEFGHGAVFPVAFPEHFISKCAESTVLDLFLGSGSTLIACEKTGRRCFGMEIDPHYCDVILKRFEDFTGKVATLEARHG